MPSNISITSEDLQRIVSVAVSTAIQEARKPPEPTAKELAEEERAQQQRLSTASSVVQEITNRRNGHASRQRQRHDGQIRPSCDASETRSAAKHRGAIGPKWTHAAKIRYRKLLN